MRASTLTRNSRDREDPQTRSMRDEKQEKHYTCFIIYIKSVTSVFVIPPTRSSREIDGKFIGLETWGSRRRMGVISASISSLEGRKKGWQPAIGMKT